MGPDVTKRGASGCLSNMMERTKGYSRKGKKWCLGMRRRNQSAYCSPPVAASFFESSPPPLPPFPPLTHPRKSIIACLGRRLASQKNKNTGLVDKDKEEGSRKLKEQKASSEEFTPLFVQNQMPAGPMQSSPNRIARHKRNQKIFLP